MIRVVQIGVGPLGQEVVRFAEEQGNVRIVGAVDKDREKIGKDMGLLFAEKPSGVRVSRDLKRPEGEKSRCRGHNDGFRHSGG